MCLKASQASLGLESHPSVCYPIHYSYWPPSLVFYEIQNVIFRYFIGQFGKRATDSYRSVTGHLTVGYRSVNGRLPVT